MVSAPVQAPLDSSAVVCRGLTKDYGQGHGLFDLDLDISRGEVLVVALVRRPLAVTVMAVLVGASYLLAWLVPTLEWPWLSKLSVFWAFAHPYLAWPSTAQVLILLGLAVAGTSQQARSPTGQRRSRERRFGKG